MMTDALSLWFLERLEAGERPWEELEPIVVATRPVEAFASWVEGLRDEKQIRNDDVTVLRIEV